jgi:hypothetical protein
MAGGTGKGASHGTGTWPPQQGVRPGMEPHSRTVCPPACVPVSVFVCLRVRLPMQAPACLCRSRAGSEDSRLLEGFFPEGRGGSRGAREPRGVVGTEKENQGCGVPQGGTRRRSLAPSSLFLRLWAPGLGRRVGSGLQAACGDVAGACPAVLTRPPSSRRLSLLLLLLLAAGSARLSPACAQGWLVLSR